MKNSSKKDDFEDEIKNSLRLQYYKLLPKLQDLEKALFLELTCTLKEINLGLKLPQRIVIVTRIKECDSAISSLRNRSRSEGGFEKSKEYSLTDLRDLVGARILYFPDDLKNRIASKIEKTFNGWEPDPVKIDTEEIALKYYGKLNNFEIISEYQVVSMLIGSFWDIEHSAYYKSSDLKGNLAIKTAYENVIKSLREFEVTYEEEKNNSATVIEPNLGKQ